MAEENKSEFAQESATPPEKTELERIQERISNYKVSISPNTALFVQNLTKQSLESPTKVEDLDAYVVIRNELAEGLAEYQTQVQNAQRRMTQLQEEHVLAKQKELADKEQKLIAEELKNSGKPEEIAKKISLGKINKFKEENSLMTQYWVMDPKKKVQDIISEINVPNLKINEFVRIKIGE